MSPGKGDYRRCIFIAGAFNNYPSVILWDESVETGPTVTAIGASGELYGLVTAVSQVTVESHNTWEATCTNKDVAGVDGDA